LPALAKLAREAMGWTDVELTAEDKSGQGGGTTAKVTGGPFSLCLHARRVDGGVDEEHLGVFQKRMATAAQVFAAAGMAPARLVQDKALCWYIEVWEGESGYGGQGGWSIDPTHTPKLTDEAGFRSLARVLASVHKLDATWFDAWRPVVVDLIPTMSDCPVGSHSWWFALRGDHLRGANEECQRAFIGEGGEGVGRLVEPQSEAMRRIVCSHGDFHPGNLLEMPDGSVR
jgi:hypothetical protein